MNSTLSNGELVLRISGLGHVPAFKNKKMIARGRLITQPKVKKWMADAVNSICFQLHSLCQTDDAAISTEDWRQSAIALLPPDDNWRVIPGEYVEAKMVAKGEEGAIIRIKKLK